MPRRHATLNNSNSQNTETTDLHRNNTDKRKVLFAYPWIFPSVHHQHQPTIVSLGRSMIGSFTAASSWTLARVAQA